MKVMKIWYAKPGLVSDMRCVCLNRAVFTSVAQLLIRRTILTDRKFDLSVRLAERLDPQCQIGARLSLLPEVV